MIMARMCLLVLIGGLVVSCVAPVNLEAERKSLLATDVRFDEHSGEFGAVDAFSKYLVDDALRLPQNGAAVRGLENIAKSLAGEYSLRWSPQDAAVSGNADMGYTWGHSHPYSQQEFADE